MRRLKRWLDTWTLFSLCAIYLAISVVAIPVSLPASRNEGTPGTFTAVRQSCIRLRCDWIGTFDSDDGLIHRDFAAFDSNKLNHPGDQVRAQAGIGWDKSIYKPDSKAWLFFTLADVAVLGYVIWFLGARRRNARRNQTVT